MAMKCLGLNHIDLGTKNMATGGWQLTVTVTAAGAPVDTHSVVVTLR